MKINKKINKIYILAFLFSLHISISAYVNSTFLSEIVGEKYVGILYAISSFLILLLLSRSSYILGKIGNRKFVFILLLINMIAILGLITSPIPYIVSIAFILFQTTNTLVFFSLDIFIEHFEGKGVVGKSRGLYLTINNLAWILSPILTGFLISQAGGYKTIYTIALVAVIIMLAGLILSIKRFKDTKYTRKPFFDTYRFLEKNTHIFAINMIFFILQFFYVWMIIYTPIYLNEHIGLGWEKIGIIFTIMLLPFLLVSIPVGILIDKYNFSKRKILFLGICVAALATMSIPFIQKGTWIYAWAIALFFTRVGASIIETTSEIYFFSHVKEEDSNLLSFFRDMSPLAYLVGPLLGTAILSFINIRYMFFVLGAILLCALYYIPRLKHNHKYEIPNPNK